MSPVPNSFLAVDIGTTNCLAAAILDDKEHVVQNGSSIFVPSMVAFLNDGDVAGEEALRLQDENPERTAFCGQSLLGDTNLFTQFPSFMSSIPFKVKLDLEGTAAISVNGKRSVSPEEVVAILVSHMADLSMEQFQNEITGISLCVPNSISLYQRILMATAVESAGYKCRGFISSCTAAVVGHLPQDATGKLASRNIVVLDVGAGSTSVSVVSLENGALEVQAAVGANSFGSDTIDQKLFGYLSDRLKRKHFVDIQTSPSAMVSLRQAARQAKIILNSLPSTTICLSHLFPDVVFRETISQQTVNTLCQATLESEVKSLLDESLERAKFEKEQISEIILVGGGAALKGVRDIVQKIFKSKKIILEEDRQERVILGAARMALAEGAGYQSFGISEIAGFYIGYYSKDAQFKQLIPVDARLPMVAEYDIRVERDEIWEVVEMDACGVREKMLMAVSFEDLLEEAAGDFKVKVTLDQQSQLIMHLTNLQTGQVTPCEISESIKETVLSKLAQTKQVDPLERMRLDTFNQTTAFSRGLRMKAEDLKLELAITPEEQELITRNAELLEFWMEKNPTAPQADILREKKDLERVLNDIISQRVKKNQKFFST